MSDPLDIAQQRRLIDQLKARGQSTTDAEVRLVIMLETLSAVHGVAPGDAPAQARGARPDFGGDLQAI
jgi:hypothetical protein